MGMTDLSYFSSGSGSGDGYGYGYGSGSGYGYGSGSGDGYGYGSCDRTHIVIPRTAAWKAYHYVLPYGDGLILRGGRRVEIGEHVHEDEIELCKCGLHASLSVDDAYGYRLDKSVLTECLVWGRIIVSKNKLVATDRMALRIVEDMK